MRSSDMTAIFLLRYTIYTYYVTVPAQPAAQGRDRSLLPLERQ